MAKIVIIGAGLTGLSTAYHLEAQGFFDYKLFEKEPEIGGLCRSVQQDGFTFDYTGHLLHINDDYFKSLINGIIGLDAFNVIKRRSFIYSQNTYTRYPYQINLYGLPPKTISECIEGFVSRPRLKRNPRSFHEWVLQSFGQGFGEHFFFPYQQKIFDYDIKKITASWTGRFVPSTSLQEMIEGAVADREDEVGYNALFFYPKEGGIITWLSKLRDQLLNPIHTHYAVKTIDIAHKKILFHNGAEESYTHLVTTMPLDELLTCIKEPADSRMRTARAHLLCNSVVNFNLGIARQNLSPHHWVYFPETTYPFYRIGFPHNFSEYMAPGGCSSLYGEFSFLKKSPAQCDELLKASLKKTKALFNIHESEIMTEKIIPIKHAYVLYTHWREKNLSSLIEKLESHDILSIGRYGAWKYSSMQEGILDGKACALKLTKTQRTPFIVPQEKAPYLQSGS
jgi:protoporphyrinogen oxidase